MMLAELTWPTVQALPRNTPVVIPIAAVEQHGHHLPLFTDSYLLGEVVRRTDSANSSLALFTPLQWLGNSDHHTDYPGTLSASPRIYLDLLRNLAENFLHHGFTRIFFLNGHGGNITPAKQAVFELRQKYRDRSDLLLLSASYWDFGKPEGLVQSDMGHACEWETSMMQCLAPNLVQGNPAALETVPVHYGFEPAYRGWITKERTPTGHIGQPQFATPEQGEYLFSIFSAGVTGFLDQIRNWDGRSWL